MTDLKTIQKAIALTKAGHISEAEAIYHRLLEETPEDFNLLSVIGLFYVNIKDYEKASEFLLKACSIRLLRQMIPRSTPENRVSCNRISNVLPILGPI